MRFDAATNDNWRAEQDDDGFLKPAAASVGESARTLHAIWAGLAKGRIAPRRDEITLALVRRLAPWMWTADVVDGGEDFQLRLTGHELAEFLGGPFAGRRFSHLPDTAFFARLKSMLVETMSRAAPVAMGPIVSGHTGKEHYEIEVIALPLSDDGEHINRLMGVVQLWPAGCAPLRPSET